MIHMPKMYQGNPAVFERKDGNFEIKLLLSGGMLTPEQTMAVGQVAQKYGAEVHLTMRQEISILGIPEDKLDDALAELQEFNLVPGSAGMTVRNVTSCLGEKYCFKSTQETTGLAKAIAEEFTGMKTPGPVKIAVSGCPFPCTRPQFNEIGLMGRAKPVIIEDKCTGCGKCVAVCKKGAISIKNKKAVVDYDKCVMCGRCIAACPEGARGVAQTGFTMFVGGRGSWPPFEGWVLHEFIDENDVIPQIRKILDVYIEMGEPKKRLREFILKTGFDEFKKLVAMDGVFS
jgi:dissimilatory sulfite reductase (desulfoviridin) alpha/beta subunit